MGLDGLEGLQACFKDKIIPLLQEYFYDDHAKIHAVLNKNGMLKDKPMEGALQKLLGDFIDTDKKIYQITEASAWGIETFIRIYKDSSQAQSNETTKQTSNP
ncbi:hypothetical protein NHP190003_07370 [Helicobacter sp. NHP19-003]|uniref:Uncharacterized protein n=1 Tax=Helicobacter gastrocanis TaxID=2849641 RepID=A0ABN6I7F5_9HELI|nr:hypothetical protein [Helicobacter sp. NHP19-003]BCZ17455.1 hypothetical protein NHP190003_07370 [Helicobacter sp. NHP19-003]